MTPPHAGIHRVAGEASASRPRVQYKSAPQFANPKYLANVRTIAQESLDGRRIRLVGVMHQERALVTNRAERVDVLAREGRMIDLELLLDVSDNIVPGLGWPPKMTTICPLGPSAVSPVTSILRHFRDEVEAMIPAGVPSG